MLRRRTALNTDSSLLRHPITPAMLTQQQARLRRVDSLPAAPGITVQRGLDDAGAYTDLVADTRASISRLRQRPAGQALLAGIQQRAGVLPPDARADNTPAEHARAAAAVNISSARGAGHAQSPRLRGGDVRSVRPAYRYDGQAGAGTGSVVRYNENEPRAARFIGLGHELIHAHRAAHGLGVSPVAVSPQGDDPILHPPTAPIVSQVLEHRAQMREEFETVGLTPTPPALWQQRLPTAPPTENALRGEHGLPLRTSYSGAVPGADDQMVRNVDEGTDRNFRWPWNPSPVQRLLNHIGA